MSKHVHGIEAAIILKGPFDHFHHYNELLKNRIYIHYYTSRHWWIYVYMLVYIDVCVYTICKWKIESICLCVYHGLYS